MNSIVCRVEIVNLLAEASWTTGRMRPVKSVVQLRSLSNGSKQILVSNAKDLNNQRFNVSRISKIRSLYISEGRLTIEVGDPSMHILLKDAVPSELESFLVTLQEAWNEAKLAIDHDESSTDVDTNSNGNGVPDSSVPSISTSNPRNKTRTVAATSTSTATSSSTGAAAPSISNPTPSTSNAETRLHVPKMQSTLTKFFGRANGASKSLPLASTSTSSGATKQQPSSSSEDSVKENQTKKAEERNADFLRRCRGQKRGRSLEITETERQSIKKQLKTSPGSLTVTCRKQYPLKLGFASTLKKLVVQNVGLKTIDSRCLNLEQLSMLDLSNNSLVCIDALKKMRCRLSKLNLSINKIKHVDDDLFLHPAFHSLIQLDISQNKLVQLPSSIVFLSNLQILTVSDNSLKCLPYNMNFLNRLRSFKAQNNNLSFLCGPLFDKDGIVLDVSGNQLGNILPSELGPHSSFGNQKFPSLLEISAESVLKHKLNVISKPVNTRGDSSTLPIDVREYLKRAKQCGRCRQLSLRYCYTMSSHITSQYARFEQLIHDTCEGEMRIKRVFCTRCFDAGDFRPNVRRGPR